MYGILIDYQYCSGCYSCEIACQSEHDLDLEQWGIKVQQLGPWPIHGTEKYVYNFVPTPTALCDLCVDRLKRGKDPSCVHHCQADVMSFGPVEDLVKKMSDKPFQVLFVPPRAAEIEASMSE